jgi:hypothetical protein
MGLKNVLVFYLSVYSLLSIFTFGYTVHSKKEIHKNRFISFIPRIAVFMLGKALVIERYDRNCNYVKRDVNWFTFPEDDVTVAVCYGTGKENCNKVQLQREGSYYQLSKSTLDQIKKLDSAFECLIRIMLKEPITNYYPSSGSYGSCFRFQLRLQRIIEVYELLQRASLYQEINGGRRTVFYLTDPGMVVNYCKQNITSM